MSDPSKDELRKQDREALDEIIANSFGDAPWPPGTMKPGARVRVLKDRHFDGPWQQVFTGKIDRTAPPQLIRNKMALPGELAYFVAFDEPQTDANGEGPYRKAQIWDRYLEPLGEDE